MKQGHERHPAINIGSPVRDYSLLVGLAEEISERVRNKMVITVENSLIRKEQRE
jgi:hypothetical protein